MKLLLSSRGLLPDVCAFRSRRIVTLKYRARLLSLLFLTLFLGLADSSQANDLRGRIKRLFADVPGKNVVYGAQVVDLQTGQTLFSHAASTPLTPASNQKLLVLATATEMFQCDSAFSTLLGMRGEDLVIIASGDPGLGDPTLADEKNESPLAFAGRWADALKKSGHSEIKGNLVVDATILDEEFVHTGWEAGDLVKWYGAPIGGLNLCCNCVDLTALPGDTPGDPARWQLQPPCSLVQVINRCETVSPSVDATPVVGRREGTFELVLAGKVSKPSKLQSVSVVEPNRFAATAIKEELERQGITISGELRFEKIRSKDNLPGDFKLVAEHATPLRDIMKRIGVNSQNMFAEALFKRVGYEWAISSGNSPATGSWENGRQAVTGFLARIGCDVNQLVIADGSGLSRDNRCSAADFVRILTYMYKHPGSKTFINSLAGNRNGGTLKRRMKTVNGDVYAKTGYIRGVRSLSGYVRSPDDHWYAFSVIFNGFRGSSSPYNRIHVELCKILAESGNEKAN